MSQENQNAENGNKVKIIVAMIGLVGVLATAILGNLDKIKTLINYEQKPIPTNMGSSQNNNNKELGIEIQQPSSGNQVRKNLLVTGKVSRKLQNEHLWVVVHPEGSEGWWPQSHELSPDSEGKWSVQAYIGTDKDAGQIFDIVVFSANDSANNIFNQYLKQAKSSGDYPENPLPQGVTELDRITVKRG